MRMASPTREVIFVWRGVRVAIVDAAGAGVERWMPAGEARDGGGAPEVRYLVEPWAPAWGERAGRYRVARDGRVRYLGSGADQLRAWLCADLDAQAARRAGGDLVVRAAAVAWREHAILLLRPGRVGVSTLAAELRRRGAAPCAERSAVIDDAGGVRGERAAPTSSAPPLALIVAVTYGPALAWHAPAVRGARAVLPLVDGAYPGPGGPAALVRRVARLAPALVTLQGRRGEAVDAAPRILAALDERLDGAAAVAATAPPLLARARDALSRREVVAPEAREVARW